MVDLLQKAVVRGTLNGFEVGAPFKVAGPDEVDEAAFDARDGGQRRLARPDLADVALALESARALQRPLDGVDAQRQRADRGAVQQRKGMGETLALAIDDEVDLALRKEIDVLRAVA